MYETLEDMYYRAQSVLKKSRQLTTKDGKMFLELFEEIVEKAKIYPSGAFDIDPKKRLDQKRKKDER